MRMPLLTTKVYIPPVRPNLVPRPHLIDQLNAGLERKLTLISAPAGFGKTALVSEWVDHLRSQAAKEDQINGRIAWLSLDENDNDSTRFLSYFIAALQTVEASLAKGALVALQSPQPPPAEAILTALINEVAASPHRIVLVLDDYHLIEARPVHDALTFLLRHLPPRTHLVIATRDDPHIALACLRARSQLTELRAADLRFSSSEAAEYLNQAINLGLSPEEIMALQTRTEGWIAGLHLAAISMQRHQDPASLIQSFTGSHRFVLDYLIEEVLDQQSTSVQAFLLQTSVLDRFAASLCDAVTGQKDGQATLEMLEHANLFIVPLDGERRWYRYHRLFADLLRQRLYQTRPEQVPTLHHRTSVWHEQHGFADEAIEHALRGGNYERAADLIEKYIDAIWERGEHTNLRRWLARLPVKLVCTRPHLGIVQAWHLFTSGQHDAAEESLQAAERALGSAVERGTEPSRRERDDQLDSERMTIRGRAAAIRAFLASYSGDVPGTIQQARRALENLPQHDSNWRSTAIIALGDAYSLSGELAAAYRARLAAREASKAGGNIHMIASLKLADTQRQQGHLHQAIAICHQQLRLARETGMSQTVAAGWLLAIWGKVLAELNSLDQAIQKATQGVRLAERGQDAMVIGWSNLCLMRVLFSTGDSAGVEQIIHKLQRLAQQNDLPPFITNPTAAWRARIWLVQGELAAASRWARERGLDAEEGPAILREMEYAVLARILIAQGRSGQTAGLLHRLLEAAETGGHTSRIIELLILQALALQAGGDTTQALSRLERALLVAEPGGFVRTFVDEGPPMGHLLYEANSRGIAPDYVNRLLAAFPVSRPRPADSSPARTAPSEFVEPLSERELEVLQLVADGLTNREIAARLFLSLNTVKVHNRNIYGKLGVNNRIQAVARAGALGILPPT
jgi:LuxR family maltose regulon positive regulatory protein